MNLFYIVLWKRVPDYDKTTLLKDWWIDGGSGQKEGRMKAG